MSLLGLWIGAEAGSPLIQCRRLKRSKKANFSWVPIGANWDPA
jgi:hypothetical protein